MNTSPIVDPDDRTKDASPTTAAPTAIDPADRTQLASRRETVLAAAIVVLIAAVVVFGLVFPQLLAPAVGIAVLAVIIALDWLLPTGELRQASKRSWTS